MFDILLEMYKTSAAHFISIFGGFAVLLFGVIAIFIEIKYKGTGWGPFSFNIVILTLILVAAMFITSFNSGTDVVTSVVGLMGTIIGFLLGRLSDCSQKNESDHNK